MMVSLLTRRLLREWKHLSRHYSQFSGVTNTLFHLKPQDSNLHIWHLVIYDPSTTIELYMKLYIGNEDEPTIILRCSTPNEVFPINRNISLTHLNYSLMDHGFISFVQQVWKLFFGNNNNKMDENTKREGIKPRLFFAWNRIICKDFKIYFPELLGNLAPGDYEMVKSYSKSIGNITSTYTHNTEAEDNNSITTPTLSSTKPIIYDAKTNTAGTYTTDTLIACDFQHHKESSSKRQRSKCHSPHFNRDVTDEISPNSNRKRVKK